jgi:hypothetical protein
MTDIPPWGIKTPRLLILELAIAAVGLGLASGDRTGRQAVLVMND